MVVPENNNIKPEINLANMNVLVAEDNTMMRMIVCKFLANSGISYKEAINGQEAVERCKSEKFDLIIMDIEMPIMSGYDAVNVLRKDGNTTPVLAHTSLKYNSILCDLRNGGFNDMVFKPFNPNDLLIRMQHYINRNKEMSVN